MQPAGAHAPSRAVAGARPWLAGSTLAANVADLRLRGGQVLSRMVADAQHDVVLYEAVSLLAALAEARR